MEQRFLKRSVKDKIFKSYLGAFYVPLSKEDILFFESQFRELKTQMVYCPDRKVLYKLGACFLLAFGRQRYDILSTSDLLENYLHLRDSEDSFSRLDVPFLFLIHFAGSHVVKRTGEFIVSITHQRQLSDKITIVLMEQHIGEVVSVFSKYYEYKEIRDFSIRRGESHVL